MDQYTTSIYQAHRSSFHFDLSNELLCLLTAELDAIQFDDAIDYMTVVGSCMGNSNEMGLQAISGPHASESKKTMIFFSLDAQPNPVEDVLTVTIENQSFLADRIEVYDMLGKKVKAFLGTTTDRIDMSGLPGGVYIVLIHFPGGELGKSKVYKL